MKLRYSGTCRTCGQRLPVGATADYDRTTKTITCLPCLDQAGGIVRDVGLDPGIMQDVGETSVAAELTPAPPSAGRSIVAPGQAGASARREYERRRATHENAVREAHPRLGGLILALSDEPQNVKAWATGARGEEKLGRQLDGLSNTRVRLLHDRRIPGTRTNIDHIAVTPTGVYVIDAKKYAGRVRLENDGGRFTHASRKLFVGTRNCTKLVAAMHKQLGVVQDCLQSVSVQTPISGMLCFVDAEWPLLGASFTVNGVHVLWPRRALRRLTRPGPLTEENVEQLHRLLAEALPAA